VKGMLPSIYVDLLGIEYLGEGWLKLKDCLAFMRHNSSCNLTISALCLWISLTASASCCSAKSLFLVLANSSASFRNLASSASYVALVVAAVAFDSGSSSP
jgi:hypothetical protein